MKAVNGMGTVVKLSGKRRKPFAVRGKEYIDPNTGKSKKDYLAYFETRKDAEVFRIAYFSKSNENTLKIVSPVKKQKNKKLTFSEVYNLWIKAKNPKASTFKNYTSYFNNSKKLHNMDIREINGVLLQSIFNDLNLTNGTLRNIKSFWKRLFDYAVLNDFCKKNYAEFLMMPSVEKGKRTANRPRLITKSELETLWKNLYKDKHNVIDIILINCYTGLRINELLDLKSKDVDIDKKCIYIRKSKNKNGIRTVPISDKIIDLVRNRLNSKSNYLCLRADNEKYLYDNFDDHFRVVFRDLGLTYHTLHDCRHTFATMIDELGVDKETIIKIMGHSNFKITSEVYIEKSLNALTEAVNKF
ncbi:MAG: site-specific integrase [Fusobacterium sp.]|nr:site-specific integrase [Fusobacterium sp.]